MAETSDNFFKLMESVGAKASMLPGAVRKLGIISLINFTSKYPPHSGAGWGINN